MTDPRSGASLTQASSKRFNWAIVGILFSLTFSACGQTTVPTTLSYAENSAEIPAPPPVDLTDTGSPSDTELEPDATEAEDIVAQDEGTELLDGGEKTIPSETVGNTVIVDPTAFNDIFIYGLGISPMSPLAYVGNTPAGVLAIPAVIQFTAEFLQIQAFDLQNQTIINGEQGLIESYPYTLLDDGRIQVDFNEPQTSLEIQQWNNCVYRQDNYVLQQPPLFADDLLTWGALETYNPYQCGQWGLPPSEGFNVHFLRRLMANESFESRSSEAESPFLFFEVGNELLNRIPYIGPQFEDGQVVYELSANFPERLKDEVNLVLEDWNDTLEEAAGNRPFTLSKQPTQALAPWDPRHRVIAWGTDGDFNGAIAPFVSDPSTGETFDGDVILWMDELDSIIVSYQDFVEKNPGYPGLGETEIPIDFAQQEFQEPIPEFHKNSDPVDLSPRVLRRQKFERRPLNTIMLHQIFNELQMTLTEEGLESYIIRDFLTHELGHNLGLRHNFRGSMDKEHKAIDISSTSSMDYVVGIPSPGSYDLEAMRYGYGSGATSDTYLSCTDEDVEIDPACARWDFGHPVLFFLNVLSKKDQQFPLNTPDQELEAYWNGEEWNLLFNRIRQFINTEHELWTPNEPAYVFDILLEKVMCTGECTIHTRLRRWYALYLLYTRFAHNDEWYDFPALTEEQSTTLWASYTELVLDPSQSMVLKKTILQKLPSSGVMGAQDTLNSIQQMLSALENPNSDEQELLNFINSL